MGLYKDIKRKVFPHSLYARSLAIIMVPILLIQLIVGVIFIDRPWYQMVDKLAYSLVSNVDMITNHLNNTYDNEEIQGVIDNVHKYLAINITIRPLGSEVVGGNDPVDFTWSNVEKKLRAQLENKFGSNFSIITHPNNDTFDINVKLKDGRIISFNSHKRRLTSSTVYIFILWLMGSSILLMAVAIIFMKNQIRPIRRLAVVAEKLGKGQDVAYFKVEGAREIRQASKAFLEMRDRIRRQIEQRTSMLAGVSHDIKTPLTRMKLQLAMMDKSDDVTQLHQDVVEMEKMLEGYLLFARGEGDETTEMCNLQEMLNRVVVKAKRQGHAVALECADKVMLRVRPVALERAVSNLVNNACDYAKNVSISVSEDHDEVELIIEDDGQGIDDEQKKNVFKPFYRVEKSRNRKTGGTGLGMSIAQDIVHSHGGDITLGDSAKGGLKVVIRLPA